MSYWRPSKNNIYVIPDIHGHYDCFEAILKRILPLKKGDILITLGDYIDRGPKSKDVVQKLIDLKDEFRDQFIPLIGNHEWLLLASIDKISVNVEHDLPSPYAVWMSSGAPKTIESYSCGKIKSEDANLVLRDYVKKIIPESHSDFLLDECQTYYELDDYVFVHAGCNPYKDMDKQDQSVFLWDNSLFNTVKNILKDKMNPTWSKNVVTGHCYDGPLITNKYMMLDGSIHKKLLVVELNSKQAFWAKPGQTRLVKCDLSFFTR